MKATHVLLVLALAALLIPFSACSSIPSPDGGGDSGVVKSGVSHGANTSIIYKDTRPRPQTGYANVDLPEQYQWW